MSSKVPRCANIGMLVCAGPSPVVSRAMYFHLRSATESSRASAVAFLFSIGNGKNVSIFYSSCSRMLRRHFRSCRIIDGLTYVDVHSIGRSIKS